MADNYIERQQEQYEARKAAWKQAQKYGKKKTKEIWIFIIGYLSDYVNCLQCKFKITGEFR